MAGVVDVTASGNINIDGLLSDQKWDEQVLSILTYSFPSVAGAYSDTPDYDEVTASNFGQVSAQQQVAARDILGGASGYTSLFKYGSFASIIDYTVAEVASPTNGSADSALLRIAQSDQANPTAYAYYPWDLAPTGHNSGGDAWFGTALDYTEPTPGDYAWYAHIHEFGHALGLKHGHETGGPANTAMASDRDGMEFSVMTYRSSVGGPTDGLTNETYGFAQTLMMYDIAALQYMYGANFTTNVGDTTYSWSPTTGEMFLNGVGQGRPGGDAAPEWANRIFLTIWDGGGNDTYDLSAYAGGVSVDLRPGMWSVISTAQRALLDWETSVFARGNVFNALLFNGDVRSYIENATGGAGADTLTGNDVANHLVGADGADTLDGGLASDILDGGGGNDVLSGGIGNDALSGGAAGSGGYNLLQGGDGVDTASYAWTSSAVYADIGSTGGHVGGVLTDIMSGIENLLGGGGADVLVGDGGVNRLDGGSGASDDLLFGGAGNDVFVGGGHAASSFNQLFGGEGIDTADYSAESGRVFVDLRAPAGHIDNGGGFVLNDLMNAVENVLGGSSNDILVGTDEVNTLDGGSGYDLLFGYGGDDVLIGGTGGAGSYNQLWGDAGADTASYAFATTRVYADLRVVAGWVTDGGGTLVLNDVYNSVENFIGGAVADSLVGDDNANRLTGGGGADLLYGFGGNDTFVYRAASESNLTTGYDSIADFESGGDRLDLTVFGVTTADLLISAAGGFTAAVYANIDGIAGYDLALVVTGTTASIQMSDILL